MGQVAPTEEEVEEMRALVVGFLQQSLKENPGGFSVSQFEKIFPDRCDEPYDWYKRYGKRTTLEALECIQDAVRVFYNSRYNETYIALDLRSDKVDAHLVDLITNQRASSKKKKNTRPASRALAAFSLNKQYAGYHNRSNLHKSRLNHGQQYRGENFFIRKDAPTFRPSIYQQSSSSPPRRLVAPNDPRNRSMIPPQVRQSTISSSHTSKSSFTTTPPKPKPAISPTPPASSLKNDKISKVDDPVIVQKKSYLRQRIVALLTKSYSEIKLLHLNSLYQLEFEDSIDPVSLGHKNLTSLMQDPALSEYIQINYKSPFITISAKARSNGIGKENIEYNQPDNTDSKTATSDTSVKRKVISYSKAKLEAVDPFNLRGMIQGIENIGIVKEPPMNNLEIDEGVKYKTLRIIFKSPNSTLKLDEWEAKFEQESRLKIRIRDYGFKTLLEFFKQLALDLPITIKHEGDTWIAVADIESMSQWIHEKLMNGHYRAATAIEVRYELIAFPNDSYTFYTDIKDLTRQEYHPAYILSVKRSNSMWIQLRDPKRIEDHLCVEASMTCYKDYKESKLLEVPKYFVRPGFPCAVFDSTQQRWCRALILKAPEVSDKDNEISALLVDYATVRNYSVSQLSCLMKTHLKLPVGPVYSRLYGVRDESSLKIQQRAKIILQEYTCPPVTLACKFRSAIPTNDPKYLPESCIEVTLVDTRHGKDCNLADDINLPRDSEGEE